VARRGGGDGEGFLGGAGVSEMRRNWRFAWRSLMVVILKCSLEAFRDEWSQRSMNVAFILYKVRGGGRGEVACKGSQSLR